MATHVTKPSEIPDAPFYVTTTDTFMSGWGPAENLTNRLILPCDSMREAEFVYSYAKSRNDQKNVRICTAKPQINFWQYCQVMERSESSSWYPTPYPKGGGSKGVITGQFVSDETPNEPANRRSGCES